MLRKARKKRKQKENEAYKEKIEQLTEALARMEIKASNEASERAARTRTWTGGRSAPIKCYKCDRLGHIARECSATMVEQNNKERSFYRVSVKEREGKYRKMRDLEIVWKRKKKELKKNQR